MDRILRQQKAEREAAEERARREAKEKAEALALIPQHDSKVSPAPDNMLVSNKEKPVPALPSMPVDQTLAGGQAAIRNTFDNLRRRFAGRNDRPLSQGEASTSTAVSPPAHEAHEDSSPRRTSEDNRERSLTPQPRPEQSLMPPQLGTSRPRTPQAHATPRSNISKTYAVDLRATDTNSPPVSNINMAIKACRGERGQSVTNKEHMQMVKESLDEGYCDMTGHAVDLSLVGKSTSFMFL